MVWGQAVIVGSVARIRAGFVRLEKTNSAFCILVRAGRGARAFANRSQFRLSGRGLMGLTLELWAKLSGLPVFRLCKTMHDSSFVGKWSLLKSQRPHGTRRAF